MKLVISGILGFSFLFFFVTPVLAGNNVTKCINQPATLTWSSTDSGSCTFTSNSANPDCSFVASANGSKSVITDSSCTVSYTCTSPNGNPTDSASLTIDTSQTWNGSMCITPGCGNGANNPPTCNTCTSPATWNGSSCVPPVSPTGSWTSDNNCPTYCGYGGGNDNTWSCTGGNLVCDPSTHANSWCSATADCPPGENTAQGVIDSVSSGTVGSSCGSISGWAFDPDVSSQSISVHIYVDGPAGSGTGYDLGATSVARPDVNTAFGITGSHGYSYQIPGLSVGNHTVYAYAIGINTSGVANGNNPTLSGSPFSFSCSAPTYSCVTPTPPNNGTSNSTGATSASQAWTYNTTGGACTYNCSGTYSAWNSTGGYCALPDPSTLTASCTQTSPGNWNIGVNWSSVAGASTYSTRVIVGGSGYQGHDNLTGNSDTFSVTQAGTYDVWMHSVTGGFYSPGKYVSPQVTCSALTCSGTAPTGSNYTSRMASTVDGTWAYGASGECTWNCDSGYVQSGNTCVADSHSCSNPDGTFTSYPLATVCPTWTKYCTDGTDTNGNYYQKWAHDDYSPQHWMPVPAEHVRCAPITTSFTINGSNNATVYAGQPHTKAWSSTGGLTWSTTYSSVQDSSSGTTCGFISSGAWGSGNTSSGSVENTPSNDRIGCITTFTYTVSNDGQTKSSVATQTTIASPCGNGANNPPTCNTCTLPYVWNGSSCTIPDACGSQVGTIQPSEPTGTNACSSGALNASSPADTASSWNWTCGSLACSASKPGCNDPLDTNYSGPVPANNYNCALTCANGGVDYPVCTPNENCVGSWLDNGTCSVTFASNGCGQSGSIQQTYHITQAQSGTGTACPATEGQTRWGGTSCSTITCPSGYFTPASASCIIPNNSNSCSTNISWTTNNPINTSAVTKDGVGGNFQTGNSGSASFSTNYSSQIYRLYNNSMELDTVTISSDCLSSSARSGGLCIACAYSGCTNHICNNGANDPPACSVCPANKAWITSGPNVNTCQDCTHGGCTGGGGSSINPNGGLVCNNTSIDVPVCTPKPNQTITINGSTNATISNYTNNNATLAWAPGSNHALYPYSSCSALGAWGSTFPPYSGTGLTTPLTIGNTYTYGYQCTNLGGTTVSNANVTVCASVIPVLDKDDVSCQEEPTAGLTWDTPMGNYTPEGHLVLSCEFADSWVLRRDGAQVDFGMTGGDDFELNKSINTAGEYTLTCTYTAGDGHVFSHTSNAITYYTKPTPPEVTLRQTPASISKGAASILRWDVKFPNSVQVSPIRPPCTLTATAVCINGICNSAQEAEQARITALLLGEQTDTNDLDGTRDIPDAVNELVTPIDVTPPGISEDWYARGKKTIDLNNSMDFKIDCGAGDHASSTVRVQVTTSNEG